MKDCHLCWAGAFTRVTNCADTRMQMRRLDRVREGMLSKVWSSFAKATEDRSVAGGAAGVRAIPGKRTVRHYKGKPFSYYGFLEKAVRPTNMAYRRRITLSYSEL